eukprot:TRINITY_DN13705_c0_g1_i1.p1 TRINITY_DN13705_c0_g1~~TRINITY_DN13705_c0_g1_i1.p1  ORF type:complete len:159 (-),score=8.37 TRINITY_DN13705_c0_g1_i1:36-512(-)
MSTQKLPERKINYIKLGSRAASYTSDNFSSMLTQVTPSIETSPKMTIPLIPLERSSTKIPTQSKEATNLRPTLRTARSIAFQPSNTTKLDAMSHELSMLKNTEAKGNALLQKLFALPDLKSKLKLLDKVIQNSRKPRRPRGNKPVSYTHLTLPTIYSV